MKRAWELKRGDKVNYGDEIVTFIKMDGAYAQWQDEQGNIRIGHSDFYGKGEDGIYIPYNMEEADKISN